MSNYKYFFHSILMKKLLSKFRTLCQIIIIHKKNFNILKNNNIGFFY
jgi:predicted patatin/cPLA2 family phospholipase